MRSLHLSLLAAVLFVHSAPAQSASYAYFGAGVGCSSPPLTVSGLPTLGGTFSVQTWSSVGTPGFSGWSLTMVATGFSNQDWGGVPLPYTLPFAPACGSVLVSPDVLLPVPATNPGGFASVPFAVPNDASLLGMTFYQQVPRLYTSCMKMGCFGPFLQLSVGGQGVIGN